MNLVPKATSLSSAARDLCSRAVDGTLYGKDGTSNTVTWQLPDETPVALQINSEPFTVMMATPANLHDFAVGFLLAEGIIKHARDVRGVLAMPVDNGVAVDVAVSQDALDTSRLARRVIEGRSGCGLCGVEDIAAAVRPLPTLSRDWQPSADAIQKAAAALSSSQPMNRLNRSVHGAAWVSRDGEILLTREDVGRHNALDKLIGALAQSEADLNRGFVLMTSRCSFELVQKSVTAGITALVTVSAPTTLALDLAVKANLFLASLGPGGTVVFNP